MLSGQARAEAMKQAASLAHAYLAKSLSGEELVQSIERVMDPTLR